MTRLDVFRQVSLEPRNLIRQWECLMEERLLNPITDEWIIDCAQKNIRCLLSLYFPKEQLEEAIKGLANR